MYRPTDPTIQNRYSKIAGLQKHANCDQQNSPSKNTSLRLFQNLNEVLYVDTAAPVCVIKTLYYYIQYVNNNNKEQ